MSQYVKVRIYSKSNGQFKANGILFKNPIAMEGAVAFNFVFKAGELNMTGESNSGHIVIDEPDSRQIIVYNSNSNLLMRRVYTGLVIDSFETVMISERMRSDSIFRNYRVVLGDEIFNVTSDVFSLDFDDIFAREAHEIASTNGVLIKSAYTTTTIYSGFGGYHSNRNSGRPMNTPVQNDKPYRFGIELELYARNRQAFNTITTARTNWFQCERDGSLSQSVEGVPELGIEMKTIPLRAVDATSVDFWDEPMAKLKTLAVSKGYNSTGLHVHISKEILGSTEDERVRNLSKLTMFYTYYVEDDPQAREKNKIICGRAQGYGNLHGAKTELGDFAKEFGLDEVAKKPEAWMRIANTVREATRGERGDINIGNWDTIGTIEFRKGKGAISKMRLAAICTWWEQMCLYTKNTHPRDFSFSDFFNKVCREYPAVAYFFQADEEC